MPVLEASPVRGIIESTGQTSTPQRESAVIIRTREMQPRGVLLSREVKGEVTMVDLFDYKRQRQEALRGDWGVIRTEFSGQFAEPPTRS